MNSKFIATAVVTLAALSSASAFAASSSAFTENSDFSRGPVTTSSLTREQVRAEYVQAEQSGKLVRGQEFDVNPSKDTASTASRAEVKAQVLSTGSSQANNLYSNFM